VSACTHFMPGFSMCQALSSKKVTEAIIYYTIYLLELAVNVPNPDAERRVSFQFVSPCFC